jgi:hypothetical protein
MDDQYTITVRFTRYHSDDDEIISRSNPGRGVTPETMREQLARELQEAYNHGFLAGHFEVLNEG